MYEFKVNGNNYKVKFGYGILVQSDLIDRLMEAYTTENKSPAAVAKTMIGLTTELLMAGLQKYHSDEFGYDPESETERKEMYRKVCDLIDDYEDEEGDQDSFTLFNDLQAELEKNGFLSKIARSGQEAAKTQNATVLPMDHQAKKSRKAGVSK